MKHTVINLCLNLVLQIKTYAVDRKLQSMLHGTKLHLIVVQIKDYDVVKREEIVER